MPIIKMDGDLRWTLPMLEGDIVDPAGPYTPEHRLVYTLGQFLRRELPGIMTKLGRTITSEQVGVTWALPHHSENLANVWITIAPMQGEFTSVDTETLLNELRDTIERYFLVRLGTAKKLRPTLDIDVDYNQGAGMALDESLLEVARW